MKLGEHHYHFHLFNLGLVPAEDRQVISMPSSLSALVPKPTDKVITVKKQMPDVEKDTMPLIIDKAKRTAWQTKKLADKLKGETFEETLSNDDTFILNYIKYQKDDPNHEQVRSPRRLIHDRKGDCDCFSVCLATLLINQGISFYFRIAKYDVGDWAHIYIIVPKNQKSKSVKNRADYIVLDPVTNKHDYEVDYYAKKDYAMSLQSLDGLAECKPTVNTRKPTLVPVKSLQNQGYVSTEQVLKQNETPYVQNANDTFTIATAQGSKNIPAVLTPDQANLLSDSSNSSSSAATDQPAAAAEKKFNWPLALAIATVTVMSVVGVANQQRPKLAGVPTQRKNRIPLLKM